MEYRKDILDRVQRYRDTATKAEMQIILKHEILIVLLDLRDLLIRKADHKIDYDNKEEGPGCR